MSIKGLVPEKVESEINSIDHPTRRFVGFALLLAWHYNLWFLHDAFVGVQLLDDCVTQSWLIALVSAAFTFIITAVALGRKRHLSDIKWLLWTATTVAVLATLALTLFAFTFPTDLIAFALAAVIGITNAILWIMRGELYSRAKTSFSVMYIGTTVGVVTLVCSLICYVLPTGISSIFIALMPLAAGVLFVHGAKISKGLPYPTLPPKSAAKRAIKPMVVVCATTFVASIACYFLVAIVPWEDLPNGDSAFTFGSIGGAALLCLIGGVCAIAKDRLNIYRIFPWLIILAIISFAFFLMGGNFAIPAFFLILAVVAIFEVLLIMYFGALGVKGYVPVGFAFGFSGAFIRPWHCHRQLDCLALRGKPCVGRNRDHAHLFDFRVHPGLHHHSVGASETQHHQTHGAAGNGIKPKASHQGASRRVLAFRAQNGNHHAYRPRNYYR